MKSASCWVVLFALSQTFATSSVAEESNDESFGDFLVRFEEAQSRFVNGDPTLWLALAARDESVTIFGAFGGYERGWTEVGPRFEWAASQYRSSGAKKSIEYLSKYADANVAYTVAIERDEVRTAGEATEPRALRVTQVFKRVDGDWRLAHRHADPLIAKRPPN